jgi:hypothetical protein
LPAEVVDALTEGNNLGLSRAIEGGSRGQDRHEGSAIARINSEGGTTPHLLSDRLASLSNERLSLASMGSPSFASISPHSDGRFLGFPGLDSSRLAALNSLAAYTGEGFTLTPTSYDKHAAYRFSLAFQCVVNIGE